MRLSSQLRQAGRLVADARRHASVTPDGYARWAYAALHASGRARAAGDLGTAIEFSQEAVRACRLAVAKNHQDADEVHLSQALLALADNLTAMGSLNESLDIVDEALAIARKQTAGGSDAPGAWLVLAGALEAQAGLVADQGDVVNALAPADEAVAAYQVLADTQGHGPTETLLLAKGLNNRAIIAAAIGDYDAAAVDLAKAVDLYHKAITAGARHGEALLSRALQAQNALEAERGTGPVHDAALGSHAYLAAARHDPQVLAADLGAASADVFLTGFGPWEAGPEPGPAPEDSTEEGTGALAQQGNTYVELENAIEAVRESLRNAAGGGDLRFQVGPIELEFGVELRADASSRAGVRVMVLTGGLDRTAGGTQHRIRLELTPQSVGGQSLMIGGNEAF